MKKHGLILAAVFAAGGLAGWLMTTDRGSSAVAQQKPGDPPAVPAAAQPPAKADGAEAGIKQITADYVKAFNAADAKAAAALWTAEGQYIGADDEVVRGRAELEKSFTEYFKANPKASIDVQVESVTLIGRGTASVEGAVTVKLPGDAPAVESRYTALHVNEDGVWRAASVHEWLLDPATAVTPANLGWLIGEWTAKGSGGELKITYAWDASKVFINGTYTIAKDGKEISRGTHIIGRNPEGGLRSWMFDSSGTFCDAIWVRDDKRWISEATGVLPDGTEINSVNIVVPLGPDSFTWQTTDRTVDDVPLPALPPVKVTRVKK
jgi:uncharacterized protein (TIGR02246 family)